MGGRAARRESGAVYEGPVGISTTFGLLDKKEALARRYLILDGDSKRLEVAGLGLAFCFLCASIPPGGGERCC